MSLTRHVGVDIGGTRVKVGLVDSAGTILARALVETADARCGPDALVGLIGDAIEALDGAAGADGVGVGVPGVLDAGGQRVVQSPNLPWIDGFGLGPALATRTGMAVRIDNDANCVIWGETRAGAGRVDGVPAPFLLGFALGTGVGGGIVSDGALLRGARGRGAEIGHLCVDPHGPPCGCGGRGCLEQYASQTGLLRAMRACGLLDGPAALVGPAAVAGTDPIVALFDAAEAGHPLAVSVVDAAGKALGVAIASLAAVLGPQMVIIAGGIATRLEALSGALEPALARHLADTQQPPPPIRVGTLGTDAGVIGAALLFDDPAIAR